MKENVKPKVPYVGLAKSEKKSTANTKPQSVYEAISLPHWKKDMNDEFTALKRNQTRSLVPYNSDLRVVDCKWVFKTNGNHHYRTFSFFFPYQPVTVNESPNGTIKSVNMLMVV